MIYSYIRRSTSTQEVSPERQREAIVKWCSENTLEVAATYEEQPVSGKAPLSKRPVLASLISRLEKGDSIVVSDISRLARHQTTLNLILAMISQKGANILFSDGTIYDADDVMSVLLTAVLGFTAEYERLQISQRTSQALKIIRKTKALGNKATLQYGWINTALGKEVNKEEQKIGSIVRKLRRSGNTYKKIQSKLVSLGIFTRNGTKYSLQGIRHMYLNFEPAESI